MAMLLGVVISFGFAIELLTFGEGVIAIFGFTLSLVGILVWLLLGNLLAWRNRALPRNVAVLGVAAALGRVLSPADELINADNVVVLSDATWRNHFAA